MTTAKGISSKVMCSIQLSLATEDLLFLTDFNGPQTVSSTRMLQGTILFRERLTVFTSTPFTPILYVNNIKRPHVLPIGIGISLVRPMPI